jgi:hypothetical protein
MDWVEIVKYLGASSVLLAAVGYVIKSIASHFLNRDLEVLKDRIKSESDGELQAFKGEQDKALQAMREAQEARMEQLRQEHAKVLQEFQTEANVRIERVKVALQRLEKLEGDLLKSRDSAYGKIWELSKCVNLFGPTVPVNCSAVSQALTDWYFSEGRLLTQSCRRNYFMIQEVLNFYGARSIAPARPAPEVLFCGDQRPVDVLIRLEAERLGIPAKDKLMTYTPEELSSYVNGFKARSATRAPEGVHAEDAWLLLHFLMSTFRSRLVDELGWRKDLQPLAPPDGDQADPRPLGNGAVVSSLGAQHTS